MWAAALSIKTEKNFFGHETTTRDKRSVKSDWWKNIPIIPELPWEPLLQEGKKFLGPGATIIRWSHWDHRSNLGIATCWCERLARTDQRHDCIGPVGKNRVNVWVSVPSLSEVFWLLSMSSALWFSLEKKTHHRSTRLSSAGITRYIYDFLSYMPQRWSAREVGRTRNNRTHWRSASWIIQQWHGHRCLLWPQ